jgi:hydroxylaminobenzene mutase
MDTLDRLEGQSHRFFQVGMLLFLFALLVGLVVPKFAVPRLGLSTHLLGIMQGIFLMVLGGLWPRLQLTAGMSRLGAFLAIYGCFAAWTANLSAAIWGAGNSMLPIGCRTGSRKLISGDAYSHHPEKCRGVADCRGIADPVGTSIVSRVRTRRVNYPARGRGDESNVKRREEQGACPPVLRGD